MADAQLGRGNAEKAADAASHVTLMSEAALQRNLRRRQLALTKELARALDAPFYDISMDAHPQAALEKSL